MPGGAYVAQKPFWIDIPAPSDGDGRLRRLTASSLTPVKKGEIVRLHYRQSVTFGTLTVSFADISKEDRPVLTLTNQPKGT